MRQIERTSDEALVLFELLERFSDTENKSTSPRTLTLELEHPSERAVIWGLTGALERELAEPFDPEYLRLLSEARERLALKAGLPSENFPWK